ncbi:hypothetical protein KP509_12G002400 [Ceratopteris richardii]|uniref:Cyanovirin-N domain-containing protein n=1 Tax=Ceratopteris richardii TaxID=49495 RepID=A0A8T2TKM7_CERRI|nr:hypothetical protein KP509_12G002400 [Ceratopteris richardii]
MALQRAEILSVICLVLAAAGLQVHACNYAASCDSESLSGTTLQASCAANNGSSVISSINLNARIGNNNGQLASCSNIGLNGASILNANCKNVNGALIQTSLDLNNCISNNNGNLQFCV